MNSYKPVKELKPHPVNSEIYRDGADEQLVESVRRNGVLQPLLIDQRNRIISGHRRWDAAQKAGLPTVPVIVVESKDDLQLVPMLLEANRQRAKTNEQVAREAACLFRVERERAEIRRAHANAKHPAKSPEQTGDAREIAAKTLGMGAKKVEQAAAVVEAIDRLTKNGRAGEAEIIRSELNRASVNRAYTVAFEMGVLGTTSAGQCREDDAGVLIDTWQTMPPSETKALLEKDWPPNSFTRLSSGGAEWARWSWDPVTGCLQGCEYCEARDRAVKRCRHGFEPFFYPGRLKAPAITKLGNPGAGDGAQRNVLTCSMADLFGEWMPENIISRVLEAARAAPQWNFLLATKNPGRLTSFQFPKNAWVGASVDSQASIDATENAFTNLHATVKWLWCEPMRDRLTFARLELFDWLVIGGANPSSQTSEFRPPRDWVHHLWVQAKAAGCKVYEMPNLLERRREYPVVDASKLPVGD
jgi:protein gp37/ParB-like chromosome segregation protein Spo0J